VDTKRNYVLLIEVANLNHALVRFIANRRLVYMIKGLIGHSIDDVRAELESCGIHCEQIEDKSKQRHPL
jgi:hypothetical protein